MAERAILRRVGEAAVRWCYAPAAAALTAAGLLSAGVLALRLAVESSGEAVGVLFALPIALVAVRFGLVGGLAAAVLAMGLIVVWEVTRGFELGVFGWLARATVFGLLGGVVGWYAQRLRAVEAAQRRLVSEAPDAIVDLDAAGRIVAANPEAERLLGAPTGGLAGRSVAELVPARLRTQRAAALRFLAAPGFRSLRDIDDLAVLGRDGEEIGVDVTLMPRVSVDGAVVRAVVRDVSAQRRASEALRHTAALLGAAEEIGGMGSWEWDLKSGRQRWSDELYRLFGLEPQSVVPAFDAFLAAVHPDDREQVAGAGRRALEQGVESVEEFRVVRPTGEVVVVEGSGRVVSDADGQPVGMIGTTRDITQRKRAERRLALAAAERARTEQTRQLLQITDAALAALPLDDLLEGLLARVCAALPADSGALLLAEAPSGALVLRATHAISASEPSTPLQSGQGLRRAWRGSGVPSPWSAMR